MTRVPCGRSRIVSSAVAAVVLFALATPVSAVAADPAPAASVLTGRQASQVLADAQRRAAEAALAVGADLRHTDEDVDKSGDWIRYIETVRVDARHHTLGRSLRIEGQYSEPAVGYSDICGGAFSPSVDHRWSVAKDRRGRWARLGSAPITTRATALLGRTHVRWTKRGGPSTSLSRLVARGVHGRSHLRVLDRLRGSRFIGGTRRAYGSGAVFELAFRDRRGDRGSLVLQLRADGAMTSLRVRTALDHPGRAIDATTALTYAAQRVVAPAPARWLPRARLVAGCVAVSVMDGVPSRAHAVADLANARPGRTTVSDIRTAARRFVLLDAITTDQIRYGVVIVGRSPLLPHPSVWTVFVRNGCAVAHKVR